MDIKKFKKQIKTDVERLMLDYLAEFDKDDTPYTKADVKVCTALLENYLEALKALKAPSDEDIMAEVEKVVLALNELNEKTDYAIIETMEREAICELIQEAALDCGLAEEYDDVTEEWREW